MKIMLRISPSHVDSQKHTATTEDLGVTIEDWGRMSEEDKETMLRQYVYGLPEQPYWDLDSWEES